MIVGRNVTKQFIGGEVGGKVPVRDGDWDVVGVFETGGDVHESEIWVDRSVIDGVGTLNSDQIRLDVGSLF